MTVLVGEIVQMKNTAELREDGFEEKSLGEFFEPDIEPDQIQTLFDNCWRKELTSRLWPHKVRLIHVGFRRMLHVWASKVGLPEKVFLPQDDVPLIMWDIRTPKQSTSLIDHAFSLLTRSYYFVPGSGLDPEDYWNRFTPDPEDNWRRFPLFPTDRICTIKCKYAQDARKATY